MYSLNSIWKNKSSGNVVKIVGLQEVTPKDIFLSHGIMPCIEFVDIDSPCNHIQRKWHILSVENFELNYKVL